MPNHAAFNWKFHRIGGLDQVTLRTPEELLHLNELDPKLWVALSCPIDKLQFDARTLELLDADKDGRIRIQEVLDAVRWTVDRLSDPALLAESRPELALEEIRQDTDEGRLLYSTASRILTQSGKEGALTQEDVAEAIDAATQTAFNGDGVIAATPTGSTAYGLSAGGPVIEPSAENLAVIPICAHALAAKSFVFAPERTLAITARCEGGSEVFISADGGQGFAVRPDDRVIITRSDLQTRLIRLKGNSFYRILQQKL